MKTTVISSPQPAPTEISYPRLYQHVDDPQLIFIVRHAQDSGFCIASHGEPIDYQVGIGHTGNGFAPSLYRIVRQPITITFDPTR